MPRFLGVLKCKGGWGVAELEIRGRQRAILLSVEKAFPRARRLASPAAKVPCLPEACYAALLGVGEKLDPRRTVLGRKERWRLVQIAYPGLPVPRPPRGMSDADVLDVLILAWAAQAPSALNRAKFRRV